MSNKPVLELHTAPAIEPLTLTEVKTYLKVNTSDDDALITNLIITVRQATEKFLKVSLISQSRKISYDKYCPSVVKLAMGPVQSITSVTAVQRDESTSVISTNAYYLSAGKRKLIFDANVVSHRVEIIYVAGYGDLADDVPNPIKQGMLSHILAIYDGRAGANVIPPQSQTLYAPYKFLSI
ncbi:MAG: hypothetical protein COV35_03540 [Alphaproteobacteria bacterium CG11_big_fil_rev_8_21_14_0_20_39_49]|nr:MAG: hypothetical protein COV35_03540 [Alphaproteobacteria bacterium CG11_big_fil_rev_8_21_14_0_20_39_49]